MVNTTGQTVSPLGLKASKTLRIVQESGWEVSCSALNTPARAHSWTF
jgi:hypothetical protein